MNENQWRLDGEMFTFAVHGFDRDRLPYPLRYLPPRRHPDEPMEADTYLRFRAEAGQRLLALADERLHTALSTLLEPLIRVEIHGVYDRGFERVVRIHAGLTNRNATIAIQTPGATKEYGGDIVLIALPPQALAGRIAAYLPQCTPGRYPALRAHRADIRPTTRMNHPTRLSIAEQIGRIANRPRSGLGVVNVFPGPALDSRPTTDGRGFRWLDYLPTDGRYLLTDHPGDEFSLLPATPEEITRQLHHAISTTHHMTSRPR